MMKKLMIHTFWLLLLVIFVSGCTEHEDSNVDLFQYKGSYVGDNSAVGNIINQLPHHELAQISLETEKEPYGITLEYKEMFTEERKETILSNVTIMFVLIKNVDWITFQFSNQTFTITRETLENWYNKKLDAFETEEDLQNFIQKQLKSEKAVQELFQLLQ